MYTKYINPRLYRTWNPTREGLFGCCGSPRETGTIHLYRSERRNRKDMSFSGGIEVIGIPLTIGTYSSFVDRIIALGRERVSSYVCVANVHMTIEAHDDPVYAAVVDGADLVTPDGMPLIIALRLLYG